MTTPDMSCARFDALLGDLLDDTLDQATREACGRHRAGCPACASLLADLEGLRSAAALLPPPAPSRDLWAAIEPRLQAPVVPLHQAPPPPPASRWRRLAVAAVALVTVSAGTTWTLMRRGASPAPEGAGAPAVAVTPAVAATGQPTTLDTLYGREIALLHEAALGSLGQLDSATAAVVRRNLAIIDQAIRESRAALAADPHSGFLLEQLDRAYGQKVHLLRRLTLL
jgi:hypothetical protein